MRSSLGEWRALMGFRRCHAHGIAGLGALPGRVGRSHFLRIYICLTIFLLKYTEKIVS